MYSAILDPQKKLGKRIGTKMLSLNASAYVAVLTEHTFKIASTEKNRPRSPYSADGRLLVKMTRHVRNNGIRGTAAISYLSQGAVNRASSRTNITGFIHYFTPSAEFALDKSQKKWYNILVTRLNGRAASHRKVVP
jgi:hypothetical protein